MSEPPTLLPLGTAVRVTGEDGVFVIIARGFQKQPTGFLAGYKGVPHPHGAGAGFREIVIALNKIAEVVHPGYEDAADAPFAKKQLESAKSPPKEQPPIAEPDLVIDVTKPAEARGAAPEPAGQTTRRIASDPRDPFKELRTKGKRT
ncbi:DUF4176 domain-containing protein [Leifsonia poae]|uniref:DUF4176 domain-containing protein n=1 Tax=Leifsonia poae TaxID=110933 RepID=UPI003D69E725